VFLLLLSSFREERGFNLEINIQHPRQNINNKKYDTQQRRNVAQGDTSETSVRGWLGANQDGFGASREALYDINLCSAVRFVTRRCCNDWYFSQQQR